MVYSRVVRAVSFWWFSCNKWLVCAASAAAAIRLLTPPQCLLSSTHCRVGKSFPWLKTQRQKHKILATATAAVTYNEKAVVLFRRECAGVAIADAGYSESLLRRVAGEYQTLLLQSGGHLVRVFN